jgi:hypothetical protein
MVRICPNIDVTYLKCGLKTLNYAHMDIAKKEQKTLNPNIVMDANFTKKYQRIGRT